MKKIFRSLSTVALTSGVGVFLITGLSGCSNKDEQSTQEQTKAKGAFVIIEEVSPGKYKVKDEFPADETRIVLKKLDGTEKVLTKEEMDALIKKEAAKIDNGTSDLTKPNGEAAMSSGMGLGEAILASAAGAIVGSWIGSKLFGNQNYQNNRKAGYKSPSTFTRSKKSFSKPRVKRSSTRRSGFFGSSSRRTTSRRSGGFFGG
jgi:hypothetical protein